LTPVDTPTFADTPTPVDVPCGYAKVSAAYPNPGYDTITPIRVDVTTSCPSVISWKVVTTAYRVMTLGEIQVMGKASLVWNQRDPKGRLASNGLYYLEISESGSPRRRIPLILIR
jgi:hypothetical protein